MDLWGRRAGCGAGWRAGRARNRSQSVKRERTFDPGLPSHLMQRMVEILLARGSRTRHYFFDCQPQAFAAVTDRTPIVMRRVIAGSRISGGNAFNSCDRLLARLVWVGNNPALDHLIICVKRQFHNLKGHCTHSA